MIIRDILAPNPGPFTLDGTRTYLLGESAVLDPGPAIESHIEAIRAAMPNLQTILITRVLYLPTRTLLDCNLECSNDAMNKVFGNQNFDPDQFNRAINLAENFLYTDENLDFEQQINESFLPEIIRLCKENKIKLILVRTKTLRFSREVPEPPALNEYMDDLNSYAQRNDVPLIDFAHSDHLPPALFTDINHLNSDGKKVFTEMLVEAIRQILNP